MQVPVRYLRASPFLPPASVPVPADCAHEAGCGDSRCRSRLSAVHSSPGPRGREVCLAAPLPLGTPPCTASDGQPSLTAVSHIYHHTRPTTLRGHCHRAAWPCPQSETHPTPSPSFCIICKYLCHRNHNLPINSSIITSLTANL